MLNYTDIQKVRSFYRGQWVEMRLVSYPLRGVIPEGCYMMGPDGLYFPKRRRGEKFVVDYTTMNRKEF